MKQQGHETHASRAVRHVHNKPATAWPTYPSPGWCRPLRRGTPSRHPRPRPTCAPATTMRKSASPGSTHATARQGQRTDTSAGWQRAARRFACSACRGSSQSEPARARSASVSEQRRARCPHHALMVQARRQPRTPHTSGPPRSAALGCPRRGLVVGSVRTARQ